MNVNKVWFYIAALAVVIGGVWASLPDGAQQQKMREAAQKRQAQMKAKKQAGAFQAASVSSAPAVR